MPFRSAQPGPGWSGCRRLAIILSVLLLIPALSAAVAVEPATATRRGEVEAPEPTYRVSPEHPPAMLKELVNGQAVVECLVDRDGALSEIKTVSATRPEFGPAAEAALARWTFKPGTVDGQPAPVRIRVPFEFKLSADQILGVVAGRPVYAEIADDVIPASQLPAWPRPLQFYIPRYPVELEGTGKYGKAVINITIDPSGKVMNPRLVKATYPEFIMPSLITAVKLTFPSQVMADGRKIYVNMDIQFDFKSPGPAKAAKKAKAKQTEKSGS